MLSCWHFIIKKNKRKISKKVYIFIRSAFSLKKLPYISEKDKNVSTEIFKKFNRISSNLFLKIKKNLLKNQ